VTSLRSRAILEGMRGEPPSDIPLLVEVIQRVSQLVEDHPEIGELDINPFVVFAEGGIALDARVRVRRPGTAGSAQISNN